jgi:hypothetical protein
MAEDKSRGTILASLAALGSVIGAMSCCLPVLPFVLAAGSAAGSAFLWRIRPYLLIASVAFIAWGFYQAWRARACRTRSRTVSLVVLWLSAAVVVVSVLFPQALANLLAGEAPSDQPHMVKLEANNFSSLKAQFNEANDQVRVILMLSPT